MTTIIKYRETIKEEDLFPSTNVKFIWDKIFSEAGYIYKSDFLNSDVFKELYIPYNRSYIQRAKNAEYIFSIGRTSSATYSLVVPKDIQTKYIPTSKGATNPITQYTNVYLGTWKIPYNDETSPNGDPDNVYDTTNFVYQSPTDSNAQQFGCNFDIELNYPVGDYSTYTINGIGQGVSTTYTSTPIVSIYFKRERNPRTGVASSTGTIIPIEGSTAPRRLILDEIPNIKYWGASLNRVTGTLCTDALTNPYDSQLPATASSTDSVTFYNSKKLWPGEKVWVEVSYNIASHVLDNLGVLVATSDPLIKRLPAGVKLITFHPNNQFYNKLTDAVFPGELINYNYIIPKNIKQKDFILSIVKMFNLYMEPDKENKKCLIIEPHDDYYNSGALKDWTKKLNIANIIDEQILAETQNKTTIFKYKDDKDYFNTYYKSINNDWNYGEYHYDIDNDFIKGEKKVELIFSPTPLVLMNKSNGFVLSKIVKEGSLSRVSFTDHNIRILTRYKMYESSIWSYDSFEKYEGVNYTDYVKLVATSNTHSFKVGDIITIDQADSGGLFPELQGNHKVIQVIDNKTIIVDVFYNVIPISPIGGTCNPNNGIIPLKGDDYWFFCGTTYSYYPYLGHLNNPIYPTYDLNFGPINGLFFPTNYITGNNLYKIYWKSYIDEISDRDSKIITAYFKLDPEDISSFKFNDKIFVDGQYYKINKIIDYDPTIYGLTKVELIKTKHIDYPNVKRNIYNFDPKSPDIIGSSGIIDYIKPKDVPNNAISTDKNRYVGPSVIIQGKGNETTGNTFITGNDNINLSKYVNIMGSGNVVDAGGSNINIIGSNNTFEYGVMNSMIVGNNLTVTSDESESARFETKMYVTSNIIDAGRDEIMPASSYNKTINYVSGSIDSVKEVGSADIIDHISGYIESTGSAPTPVISWAFDHIISNTSSATWSGNTELIGSTIHTYVVPDNIYIYQTDGGILNPAIEYPYNNVIKEISSSYSIVLDTLFSSIGPTGSTGSDMSGVTVKTSG